MADDVIVQSEYSKITQGTNKATTCTIDLEQSTTQPGNVSFLVFWSSATKVEHLTLPHLLLKFLFAKFGPRVHICTHYKCDTFSLRCHPAFQSGNEIHDCMLVKVETEAVGNQEAGVDYFPCKLAVAVFNDDPKVTNDNNKYRLVSRCTISYWCEVCVADRVVVVAQLCDYISCHHHLLSPICDHHRGRPIFCNGDVSIQEVAPSIYRHQLFVISTQLL